MWPANICNKCGRRIATMHDYNTIKADDGQWLCWEVFGTPCEHEATALQRLSNFVAQCATQGLVPSIDAARAALAAGFEWKEPERE